MKIDLSGQSVLVTGAGRGIGEALARALAASGARVAIHANRSLERAVALASEIGGGAQVFRADLALAADASRLVPDVIDAFGRLDVLVNNAGIALEAPLDAPDQEWLDRWDQTLDINLRSTALLCRATIRHVQTRDGGGRIINIASRAAFRGDTSDYLAYAASKGGMVSLTRSVARAYGAIGVTAFIIAPGFTRSDMAQEFIDRYGEAHAARDIALDRLTEPEDIAPFVVLLASGLADHATGCTIDINAGSYVH